MKALCIAALALAACFTFTLPTRAQNTSQVRLPNCYPFPLPIHPLAHRISHNPRYRVAAYVCRAGKRFQSGYWVFWGSGIRGASGPSIGLSWSGL